MKKNIRVRRYRGLRKEKPPYTGNDEVQYQCLEEKRWYGWVEIDREEIPMDVVISIGALGYSDWVSKFSDFID